MTKTHAKDREGSASMILDCPGCGWTGLVFYTTKRPVYCSDVCKQRTYRRRKAIKRNEPDDANLTRQKIERELDQALHLLSCACGRGIWTVRGNVQIGGLRCDLCGGEFKEKREVQR